MITYLAPGWSVEDLGYIPYFISEGDDRSAKEQFNANYGHGGGWHKFEGFRMMPDGSIQYPGDPVEPVIAEIKLRDEVIRIYDHAWVSITQPDGSYEIARMD